MENQVKRKRLLISLRSSSRMKKYKRQVMILDNTQCQICKDMDNLSVHHRTPLNKLLDLWAIETKAEALECEALWELSNGEILCLDCHTEMHR